MTRGRVWLVMGLLIWFLAVIQFAIGSRWTLIGASPDYLLIGIAASSFFLDRMSSAGAGFMAGLAQGAIAGANLGQYITARCITGFLAGWFHDSRHVPSNLKVFLGGVGVTLVSRLVLMFMAPPTGIGSYLAATILSAVYNGVLVLPVYLLLKRVLDPVYR